MNFYKIRLTATFLTATLSMIFFTAANPVPAAETAAQFYQGKTIEWVTSGLAGGSTDLLARVLAPYLAKETGAQVKVEAMGSDKSVNYVYGRVKPDGLTLLTRDTASLKLSALLKTPGARWDLGKFNWLADALPEKAMFGVSPKLAHRTLEGLKAAEVLKAGGTGARGGMAVVPAVMFEVFGLNGKVISGYRGVKALALALAKGEIDVISGSSETTSERNQKEGHAVYLFTLGNERSALFPDLPAVDELGIKIPQNAQDAYELVASGTGKAVATSPGVPADRIAYLRRAFDNLVADPEVKKSLKKFAKSDPKYIPGEKLQADMVKLVNNQSLTRELEAIINKYLAVK
ncbi:MAG: tripartite tricarboxylate transporter substrate-binding protein [Desulfobacterales bacterium]|nr:tripartite tricarboxylate transporter substrate-binding protein [Desulfobacterales bacterium]